MGVVMLAFRVYGVGVCNTAFFETLVHQVKAGGGVVIITAIEFDAQGIQIRRRSSELEGVKFFGRLTFGKVGAVSAD